MRSIFGGIAVLLAAAVGLEPVPEGIATMPGRRAAMRG